MGWDQLSTNQKLGIAAGVGLGLAYMGGYFTGGVATVARHKNVLTAAKKGYSENRKLLARAERALARVRDAEKQIKKASARGRVGKAVFGDEAHWEERRMAEKAVLRNEIYELRTRIPTMTSSQERRLHKLERAVKSALPSAVERSAILGIA